MLRMQTTTENGKVHGKVTTIQSMGALGPLIMNGVTIVNTRYIAPLNIPGTVSMKEGLLEKLAEGHYKITPFRDAKEVTATIFNKNYTGALIELNGEVVIVDGVQMTNGSKAKPAAESPTARPLLSDIVQPPKQTVTEGSKAPESKTQQFQNSLTRDINKYENVNFDGEHISGMIGRYAKVHCKDRVLFSGKIDRYAQIYCQGTPTITGDVDNYVQFHCVGTPNFLGKVGDYVQVNGQDYQPSAPAKSYEESVICALENLRFEEDMMPIKMQAVSGNAKILGNISVTMTAVQLDGRNLIVPGNAPSKTQQAAESPKTRQLLSGIIQPPANHNETKKSESTLTALHKAAANNDTISITNLINQGEEVDIENHRKWTPLHFAAARGHLEAVELLLQKGANAEKITGDHNGNGCTPAELAASSAEDKDPVLKLKFLKIKDILELHIQNSKKMITNGR